MINVRREELGNSHVPVKNPFGDGSMSLVYPGFGQVKKSSSDGESGEQEPEGSEETTGERLECAVTVPDRGDRHDRQVQGIDPPELLHVVHHPRAEPDAEDHDAQSDGDFKPDPHPPFFYVHEVRLRALPSLDGAEQELFLEVKQEGDHGGEENVDEAESHEHEGHGEEFGGGGVRGDVAVADGAHGDNTEVERVDKGVRLSGGEVRAVEDVDEHAEGEVEDEEDHGLPDYGRRCGHRLGGLLAGRAIDFVDGRHGGSCLGPVQVRFEPVESRVDEPLGRRRFG